MAGLIGKTLATIGDARLDSRTSHSEPLERLLRISGEDPIEINRKYQDQVDIRLGVRIMILSNRMLKVDDASSAFTDRLLILQTVNSFLGRENLNLEAELLTVDSVL